MTAAALHQLEDCHHALIGALDAHDINALEGAIDGFRRTVEQVRTLGAWRDNPEILDRITAICSLNEAARIRVHLLADINQRRMERLAALRGMSVAASYRRDGTATL